MIRFQQYSHEAIYEVEAHPRMVMIRAHSVGYAHISASTKTIVGKWVVDGDV